jgi:hypothetical protein
MILIVAGLDMGDPQLSQKLDTLVRGGAMCHFEVRR